MKKLICLLICVSLALSLLASCGGGNESGNESAAESGAEINEAERSGVSEQPQYGEISQTGEQPGETSSGAGEENAETSAGTDWEISASDAAKTVFAFRGTKITAGEHAFVVATYKAYLKSLYESYMGYDEGSGAAFDAYLRTATYGENGNLVPVYELMNDSIIHQLKYTVILRQLCAEYGLEITDEGMLVYIEEFLQSDIDSAGGPQAFKQRLEKFGLNEDALKQTYYADNWLDSLLFEYLYGEDGVRRTDGGHTEEELKALFESTNYKYDAVVYQPAMYYEESMTEEEFDALDAKMAECAYATYEKIKSGELEPDTFADEDVLPDGYGLYTTGLVTDGTFGDEELIELLAGLKDGECAYWEDFYGDTYIVIKRTLNDDDFADYYDYFYAGVLEEDYAEYMESLFAEVEVDEEELAKYGFLAVPTLE